jgi:hypothetical protein
MYDDYDYDSHWVSGQIENGFLGIEHPLLVSIFEFSMPWNVLAGIYTVLYWDTLALSFLYPSALGLLWVNLAPFLIWYYDERVLPEFFAHLSELVSDPDERHALAEKYNRFFGTHRLSVSLFWAAAAVAIIYVSEPVLQSQGMAAGGAVFLWTTYAYAVYVGAVLSHGFVGPVMTLLLVREVTEYDLEIDPLHPDGLGGLSTVGYVSIRTTLLFSSGSLFLPLLFYFSSAGGASTVIFGFTGLYVLIILLSFVYPTAIVNRRAGEYRDAVLDDLRQQYAEIEREIEGPDRDEISELNKRLELQRVQRNYDNYSSVSLYPLQLSILTRLAGSIFLPILFMVIEIYLPNLL